MLCGFIYKKWLAISFTMVGIFSLLFGILLEKSLTPDAHSLNMMAGMLSGLGGTFTVVGIIRFIYLNIHSSEKLKLDGSCPSIHWMSIFCYVDISHLTEILQWKNVITS